MKQKPAAAKHPRELRGPSWSVEEMLLPLSATASSFRKGEAGVDVGFLAWHRAVETAHADEAKPKADRAALVSKSPDCFLDSSSHDLAGYIRWLLVLRWVCSRIQSSRADETAAAPVIWTELSVVAKSFPTPRRLKLILWKCQTRPVSYIDFEKGFKRAFHRITRASPYKSAAAYARSDAWNEALVACVNQLRTRDLGSDLKQLDVDAVLRERIIRPGEAFGPELFERFTLWLRLGSQPARDDLSRLHAEVYLTENNEQRRLQLEQIVQRLSGTPVAQRSAAGRRGGHAPLINVYSASNPTGLRAFATKICTSVKSAARNEDRQAMVYIPLSRGATEGRPLDRRDVISLLLGAFGQERDVAADNQEAMESLRRSLTLHRTLLVFDGFQAAPEPFEAIFDLVRTDWVSLIRSLIQPDLFALPLTGGEYRTTCLLLSDQPLHALEPWMEESPELLAHFGKTTNPALLFDLKQMAPRTSELEARCAKLWPLKSVRPRGGEHSLSLMALYPLEAAMSRAVFAATRTLPTELDLTFAWCAQQSADAGEQPAAALFAPERRLPIFRRYLYGARSDVGETVALQFVALSIDGLRITTLRRTLREFIAVEPVEAVCKAVERTLQRIGSREGVDDMVRRHRTLVALGRDEYAETIPDRRRWFDLQALPREHEDHATAADDALLVLRLEALREWFHADLIRLDNTHPAHGRFARMHKVLAEESLVQATSQLRGHLSLGPADAYSLKRFVQVVYHGLLSDDFSDAPRLDREFIDDRPTDRLSGALPVEPSKRLAYLYEFTFRRCIENAPQWMLGRGFARDGARFALLTMFVNPVWVRRTLGALAEMPSGLRTIEGCGAFANASSTERFGALNPSLPHLEGAIGYDVFQALLHAAQHTGHRDFAATAEDIEQALLDRPSRQLTPLLPGGSGSRGSDGRSQVAQLLETAREALSQLGGASVPLALRDSDRYRRLHVFRKIGIDAMSASGRKSPEVQRKCLSALEDLGVDGGTALASLGKRFEMAHPDKAAFENLVLAPAAAPLFAMSESKAHLEYIADMLYRLGESLAIAADEKDRPGDLSGSTERYLNAYSVYWIGDRVRSAAAMRDRSTVDWPIVSARAMRYFVRVSLKVAKLLSKRAEELSGSAKTRYASQAHSFYVYSRGRIDAYSRHLFRIPLEQIWTALLLASAARIRSSISRSIDGEPLSMRKAYLDMSLEYIVDAERQLMRFDFHSGVCKRFFLERVKTLNKLSRLPAGTGGASVPKVYRRVIARDLGVLKRLTKDDDFWRRLVRHVEEGTLKPLAPD